MNFSPSCREVGSHLTSVGLYIGGEGERNPQPAEERGEMMDEATFNRILAMSPEERGELLNETTFNRILAMSPNELLSFASLLMPDCVAGDQEARLMYSLCLYLS